MDAKPSFTGRVRRHQTRWSVRLGEILSRLFITVGGIGTIIAVALVSVFLAWVVVPLFLSASATKTEASPLPGKAEQSLRMGVDEYQLLGWSLFKDGTLAVFRLDTGKELLRRKPEKLYSGSALTACSSPGTTEDLALGFADGSVQLGRIGFAVKEIEDRYLYLPALAVSTAGFLGGSLSLGPLAAAAALVPGRPSDVPESLRDLAVGQRAVWEEGVLYRTPQGQLRLQQIKVDLEDPLKPEGAAAVVLLDLSLRPTGPVVSILTTDGKLRTNSVSKRENFETGETVKELSGGEMSLPPRPDQGQPAYLLLAGAGNMVFLAWQDGHLLRVNTQNLEEPKLAEELELLSEPGLKLTALQMLNGRETLLAGDSSGRVTGWFRIRTRTATAPDGTTLAAAHRLPGPAAVTSLASSSRNRSMAAGYANGAVRLFYVPTAALLAEVPTAEGQPITSLTLSPKNNGLVALGQPACGSGT